MESVGRCWFIVGCYLDPNDAVIIKHTVPTISQSPHGVALLVDWDFNTDLAALEGSNHREDIAAAVAAAGMEEISTHFLPRQKYWERYGRTQSMHRQGR